MNENIGFKQLFSVIKEKMAPSDPDCPDRNGHFSLLSVLCLDSCISGNHSNFVHKRSSDAQANLNDIQMNLQYTRTFKSY